MTHFIVNLTVLVSLVFINLAIGNRNSKIIFPGNTRSNLVKYEDKNGETPRKPTTDWNVSSEWNSSSSIVGTIERVINNFEKKNEMKNQGSNLNSLNEKGEERMLQEKSLKKQSSFDELSYDFSKTNNIYRVSDLLKFLGVQENTTDDSLMVRRSNDDPAQVACHSEWRTVDLSVELNKNAEDFKIFPKCIKAKRCAGCCGFNSGRVCTPTKIDKINVNAAVIRVKRSCDELTCSSEIDKDNLRKVLQIDTHEECTCKCKMNEKNCNENQDFDEQTCKCNCRDTESSRTICEQNSQKKWNDKNCQCECKKTIKCSTGLVFSPKTCSCARKRQA